jgi:hypothetical protein
VEKLSAKAHWVTASLFLVACASGNSKPFEPRFDGVWSDARNNHWVEVDSNQFAAFGVTPDGRCAVTRADAVARDRVVLPVSAVGVGPMSLSLDGTALVVAGKNGAERFARASREVICRDSRGAYLPGAPYPKPGS